MPPQVEGSTASGPARCRTSRRAGEGRWPLVAAIGAVLLVLAGTVPAGGATGPPPPRAVRSAPADRLDLPVPRPATNLPPRVPPSGAYFGADPNFSPGQSTASQAVKLGRYVGRSLSIVSFYVQFQNPPPAEMALVAANGSIPMINVNCGPSDASVMSGAHDGQLRADAEAYRRYGGPVLLRWFWEMNLPNVNGHLACLGPGEPKKLQEQQFVGAYQHIWKIFHEVGADNVAFVWAPSAAASAPSATGFYPGSPYVDWIGADVYDRPGHTVFAPIFKSFYGQWAAQHKPIILSETGAVGSPAQVSWLQQIEADVPAQFPDVHAFVYVDAVDLDNYVLGPGTPGMAEYRAIGKDSFFSQPGPADGYVFATSKGVVRVVGSPDYGSLAGRTIPAPIVGLAAQGAKGYWLVGADGAIYPFGGAADYGSMRGHHLNRPIVGVAATPDGRGYWMVAADGGLFSFGDARYYGSMGGRHLNKPIVGIAATSDGGGYWFVASDGGIFTFGNARFRGSTAGKHLNRPIVGMAAPLDGDGYWLVASDGGIFTFGNAPFLGSLGATRVSSSVTGIALDPLTGDYRLVTAGGPVYQFPGQVEFLTPPLGSPAVAIAAAQ